MFVLSIHSDEHESFELLDILRAFGEEEITGLIWGIAEVDCTGLATQELVNQLNPPGSRKLVSGQHLITLSQECEQVLEGDFIGYLSQEDAHEFLKPGWRLSNFTTSRAKIAITVVDGCIFDVYLRSQVYVDRLHQRFKDVRHENLADFLDL